MKRIFQLTILAPLVLSGWFLLHLPKSTTADEVPAGETSSSSEEVLASQNEAPVPQPGYLDSELSLADDKNDSTENQTAQGENDSTASRNTTADGEESSTESAGGGKVKILPLTFNGLESGSTTVAELTTEWGEPTSVDDQDGLKVMTYSIVPFEKVTVTVQDDVVLSINIDMKSALPVDFVASQLKMEEIAAVDVLDQFGQTLGIAFPERGVLFSIPQDSKKRVVRQIILEPIDAEYFVLRVVNDNAHQYERSLEDLEFALSIAPENPYANWLMARLLSTTGYYAEALIHVERAVSLDNRIAQYQLTLGKIHAELGHHDLGLETTRAAMEMSGIAPEIKARGLCQLGDLVATGTKPDYPQAMKHHLAAIELAVSLVNDERYAVRHTVKKVLIDAHLAVTRDIAMGNWQQKNEIVPQWLNRAEALSDEMIKNDGADPALRLQVYGSWLATCARSRGAIDPEGKQDQFVELARQLDQDTTDNLYRRQLAWETGEAMLNMLRIEQARGRRELALKFGKIASKLLEAAAEFRPDTPQRAMIFGELYFLIGSVHAIHDNDHVAAKKYYSRSLDQLDKALTDLPLGTVGQAGEWLVSMGVSFWTEGDQDRGRQLTDRGVVLIKDAISKGGAEAEALVIPYGNLANMSRMLGHEAEANDYESLISKILDGGQENLVE